MRKIYIDANGRCHTGPGYGLEEIETSVLDDYATAAIAFFVFVPAGRFYNGSVCAEDFCQCTNSAMVDMIQAAYSQAKIENREEARVEMQTELDDKTAALEYLGVVSV